jgi:hypothetical protein
MTCNDVSLTLQNTLTEHPVVVVVALLNQPGGDPMFEPDPIILQAANNTTDTSATNIATINLPTRTATQTAQALAYFPYNRDQQISQIAVGFWQLKPGSTLTVADIKAASPTLWTDPTVAAASDWETYHSFEVGVSQCNVAVDQRYFTGNVQGHITQWGPENVVTVSTALSKRVSESDGVDADTEATMSISFSEQYSLSPPLSPFLQAARDAVLALSISLVLLTILFSAMAVYYFISMHYTQRFMVDGKHVEGDVIIHALEEKGQARRRNETHAQLRKRMDSQKRQYARSSNMMNGGMRRQGAFVF